MPSYSIGYYTLSDGTRYVHVDADDPEKAKETARALYDDVDHVFFCHAEPAAQQSTVYCIVCEDEIAYSEIRKRTGDDEYVYSECPGCGRELLEPYLPL